MQLASTPQVADWTAAHERVRDERVERRADGGVAGCGTMHDAAARDWNACSGRPGETNVPPRIRQLVSSRVKHVHGQLDRGAVVHDDGVGASRDQARRRTFATSNGEEDDDSGCATHEYLQHIRKDGLPLPALIVALLLFRGDPSSGPESRSH